MKKSISMAAFLLLGASTLMAQIPQQQPQQQQPSADFSDEQLEQFAVAFQEVQEMNSGVQDEMMGAIEEEGLDVERFNKIQQAQQNPEAKKDISEEEMKKFENCMQAIQKVQMQAQKKMESAVQESGLDMNTFQQIMRAMQENPEIQQKVQKKMPEQN